MSSKEFTILTDACLITCIVQRGAADKMVAAAQEAGAQGATIFFGRGSGVRERLGILGLAVEAEKEMISIIVAEDQADRVFEKLYFAGELNVPGMGIISLTRLEKVATFIPHEIIEKVSKDHRDKNK
jgi:nitrogen regulatory protein P-II 1